MQNSNFKYKLDDERLDWLVLRTNRSKGQTQFLFNLLEGDFEKLKLLEMKIKNCLLYYCPGNMEEVEKIFLMKDIAGFLFFTGFNCRYKTTGHVGIIRNELFKTNWKNPTAYGIYWYGPQEGTEHAERNRKCGILHYWQTADKLLLI